MLENRIEFAVARPYFSHMGRSAVVFALSVLLSACSASAATGKVIKVLPFFLDFQGRHSVSPSLYERDAYQVYLRTHPDLRSGMLFEVQWKTRGKTPEPLRIKVELRGMAQGKLPSQRVLEREVKPGGWFSHWTAFKITGEEFAQLGEVTAWRVTLWQGADLLLGEQQSFLW